LSWRPENRVNVLAVDFDAAACWLLETAEQAHEGALSASAAADDRGELAVGHAHRHAPDSRHGAVPGAERLRYFFCFEHGHSLLRASAGWILLMRYDAAALPNAAIRRIRQAGEDLRHSCGGMHLGEMLQSRVLPGRRVSR
jgi:hypothetical protein